MTTLPAGKLLAWLNDFVKKNEISFHRELGDDGDAVTTVYAGPRGGGSIEIGRGRDVRAALTCAMNRKDRRKPCPK